MGLFEKFKPTDFQTKEHYWSTFGHAETETSAAWIIQFLQYRMTLGEVAQNGWAPFTYQELNNFYNSKRGDSGKAPEEFYFNRLAGTLEGSAVYIVGGDSSVSRTVTVTEYFIAKLASQPRMLVSQS